MAIKPIPLKEALKKWEATHEIKATDSVEIKLNGHIPPIDKLDATLSTLVNCEKLSLSSNYIERISNFQGLTKLKILSLGRNALKSCTGIESLADSLEQLWISYNNIEKLKGIAALKKLKVLYMSNNNVKDLAEVKLLGDLPFLTEFVFVGNPLEEKLKPAGEYEKKMSEILPHLKKLDGNLLTQTDVGEEED